MKKKIGIFMLVLAFLVPSVVAGQMVFDKNSSFKDVKVEVNGVLIQSPVNYQERGTIFVGVDEYTTLLNVEYTFDQNSQTVTINGETIPVVQVANSLAADVNDLARVTGGDEVTFSDNGKSVYVLDMPDGAVKWHPPIPAMGQHWILEQENMENPPFPKTIIYGSFDGKLVFIEQMIQQDFFINGESITELDGMLGKPSPAINHTNIEFIDGGHPGLEVSHYDIHHYFITPEERLAIQPDGHEH